MHFLSPDQLVATFGQAGIVLVIFVESCIAFFLPGDSLLFTGGLLAVSGHGLNIYVLTIGTSVAAVAGNQLGYAAGRKAGPAVFRRPNSRFLKQSHLEKTHHYFERYGPKTIVLARFIPVVRTFACYVAGAGRMEYRVFLTYNVIGGVLWAAGVTLLGFALGQVLPEKFSIDTYLLPIIAVIIVISVLPAAFEYYRARKHFSLPSSGQVADRVAEVDGAGR